MANKRATVAYKQTHIIMPVSLYYDLIEECNIKEGEFNRFAVNLFSNLVKNKNQSLKELEGQLQKKQNELKDLEAETYAIKAKVIQLQEQEKKEIQQKLTEEEAKKEKELDDMVYLAKEYNVARARRGLD